MLFWQCAACGRGEYSVKCIDPTHVSLGTTVTICRGTMQPMLSASLRVEHENLYEAELAWIQAWSKT